MITQDIMNEWHKNFTSASKFMNYAGMIFNYAIRIGIITTNSAKKQKVKVDKDLNFYDKEELKKFMEMLENGDTYKAYVFFRVLTFTGIKKGEALALQWSDVNTESQILNINKATSRKSTGFIYSNTKKPASIRRISLDDKTLTILESFRGKR